MIRVGKNRIQTDQTFRALEIHLFIPIILYTNIYATETDQT
jgi:hypothetical protein